MTGTPYYQKELFESLEKVPTVPTSHSRGRAAPAACNEE